MVGNYNMVKWIKGRVNYVGNKENYSKYFIYGIVIIVILGSFVWFSGCLPSNRGTTEPIRVELDRAREQIDMGLGNANQAIEHIDRSQTAIEAGQSGIRDSITGIETIETGNNLITTELTECLRLNRESQSIVRSIRKGSKTN